MYQLLESDVSKNAPAHLAEVQKKRKSAIQNHTLLILNHLATCAHLCSDDGFHTGDTK